MAAGLTALIPARTIDAYSYDTGLAEGRHRLSDGAFLDGPAPDDEDSSGALNITIVTPGNLDAMVHRLTHGMTWGG